MTYHDFYKLQNNLIVLADNVTDMQINVEQMQENLDEQGQLLKYLLSLIDEA